MLLETSGALRLMVFEIDGVVAPEIWPLLHPLNDLVYRSEKMISKSPDTDRSFLRAKCQIAAIAGELHRGDIEDRVHLCCNSFGANFIHQDGRAAEISLVEPHIAKFLIQISQVTGVAR